MWTAHLSQQKGALWPSYSARIREVVAKKRVGQDHRLTQPAFAEINHALSAENVGEECADLISSHITRPSSQGAFLLVVLIPGCP